MLRELRSFVIHTKPVRLFPFLILLFAFAPSNAGQNQELVATAHTIEEPLAPLALCWHKDTDPAVVDAFIRNLPLGIEFSLNPSSAQLSSRWSSTATNGTGLGQGDPTVLTWSIVPDGTNIDGFAGEPSSPSNLVARLGSIYGVSTADTNYLDEPWFHLFAETFDRWSELSGIDYVYEPADDGADFSSFSSANPGVLGVRGDVRIGGHPIDGNSGVLGYNFFPNNSEMVLDTDDTFFNNVSNSSRRLRNVVAHEAGHGLGFRHVESNNASFLMEPFINTSFDGPQLDEVLGVHRHYGDAEEPGDNATGALALGVINPGDSFFLGGDAGDTFVQPADTDFLSIDDDSDADWYSFTASANGPVTVTITPVGPTYNQGPQNGTQAPLDVQAQSDLSVDLIDTDQITVLATANAGALASPEVIFEEPLTAGTYYVRVSGLSSNKIQLYSIQVDIPALPNTPPTAVCQDVQSCDGDVTALEVDNGSSDPDLDPLGFVLEPTGPYAPGVTNVNLIVSDGTEADTCSAQITVNQAPVAACQDIMLPGVQDSSGCFAEVDAGQLDNGSFDPDGDNLNITLVPAGPYFAGENDILFIVADSCGAADTCAAKVIVECAVPVELAAFSVNRSESGAVLQWEVAEATDHAGFHVFQQQLGSTRDKVTNRLLTGSDQYMFVDASAPRGPVDYWLQEISRSGLATWHGPFRLSASPFITPSVVLAPARPNPFAAATLITYNLPEASPVRLEVFDAQGRLVRTLANGVQAAGEHVVRWNGDMEDGGRAAAGLYIVRLGAGNVSRIQKTVYAP
ncbi:MAG: matrixin family metalloprotease [Candidatus Eisenbacteria bacterium]|uniref:Matrixin family metalloprotease n=1 Tax=Eiseniibacteriota bacterium TaxID=2212470 RepID=A0A7Y2H3G1_UNCEI|nr:matrixin family metalloprotease [Candidatus Eisenbacteria bacterium]